MAVGIIKFQLEGINFGIYAEKILEIVQYTKVRKIPMPLPYVVGLVEFRNHIVSVVDLRKRLRLSPTSLSHYSTMIIAKLSAGILGILVEAISDFRQVDEQMILPPISIAGFPEHLLIGVLAEKDDIMLLPNLDKIFSSYLSLQLLPISPSEKIAFQYRFTPGSLTRTLEQNLINQHYLDHNIVRRLPRSMCLPSVLVHKVTSFYPNFQPRQSTAQVRQQHLPTSQKIKAGDERYVSLSQQLRSYQTPQERQTKAEKLVSERINGLPLAVETPVSIAVSLENLLHQAKPLESSRYDRQESLPNALVTQPEIGRRIAKVLRVPPTRLTKYFSFYTHRSPSVVRETQHDRRTQLQRVPPAQQSIKTQWQQLFKQHHRVHDVLQTLLSPQSPIQLLHKEGKLVLTRPQLQLLCQHYRMSPVDLAKLGSFFPEFSIVIEEEENIPISSAEKRDAIPTTSTQETTPVRPVMPQLPHHISAATPLDKSLYFLAEEHKLAEDQYLRAIADRLQVSTCRLSKLRSYYQWNNQ